MIRGAALALAGLLAACAAPSCDPGAGDALPVTMQRGLPIVQAQVNGTPAPFVLDTGATTSVMLPEGAAQLGLPLDPARTTRGRGVGGSFEAPNVLVNELRLGRRAATALSLPVIAHAQPGQRVMAGVLGVDVFGRSELEIDMPARRVTLRPPGACAGPDWSGGYDTIPVRVLPEGWVIVPLRIEGQPVQALLDTGAALSTIRQSVALRLGMPPAVLSGAPAGQVHGAGQNRLDVRPYRFDSVQVGREALRGVTLGVTALPDADPFDMVLGQDYIGARRLWLSYATQRLYVQPAGAPR